MRALIWREFKVAFGSIFGLVFQFLTPVFLLLFFATVLSTNLRTMSFDGSEVSYLVYFTPGLFGYVTFMILSASLVFLRMDSQSGILEIIILSRVSINGYFWGKYFVVLILAAIKILLLLIIAILLSGYIPQMTPVNIVLFLLALNSGTLIWYSLGIIGGVFIKRDDMREVVMMMIALPLTFASTMYYSLEAAPEIIKAISYINPLTYICNIFRSGYLGSNIDNMLSQVYALAAMAIVLLILAMISLKKVRV